MSYKPFSSAQVKNVAALGNIGSVANDTLNDILNKINAALGASGSGQGYIAKQVTLTSGQSSCVVTIPAQTDTSYIVLAMMGNVTDTYPQFQQVQIKAKSTTGFTISWNQPVDTNNYFINYIIPFKTFVEVEAPISSGVSSVVTTLPLTQAISAYPVIAQLQNLVDTNPKFEALVIGNNSTTALSSSFNTVTDSSNYQEVYGIFATGQAAISSGATSVTINVPVNFNTTNYAAIASIQNKVDAYPQYQPMIISAQTASSVTFKWNIPRDTANYLINYYVISLTA